MVKVRAQSILACGLLLAGGFFVGISSAEQLSMGGTEERDNPADPITYDASARPTRGMTQISVEARYGVPQSTTAAVGDPPISKWEYEKFVVFFEYDRVIHAVLKR